MTYETINIKYNSVHVKKDIPLEIINEDDSIADIILKQIYNYPIKPIIESHDDYQTCTYPKYLREFFKSFENFKYEFYNKNIGIIILYPYVIFNKNNTNVNCDLKPEVISEIENIYNIQFKDFNSSNLLNTFINTFFNEWENDDTYLKLIENKIESSNENNENKIELSKENNENIQNNFRERCNNLFNSLKENSMNIFITSQIAFDGLVLYSLLV